jgi:poly-gamma-glutamate capsule biosynthesis protein CapA/YwtB (metallophosphatase superfamily)
VVLLALLALSAFAQDASVTLSAVGDIRLDGPVGQIISSKENPTSNVEGLLAADIVFGNLECPLTKRGVKTPKTWNFRAPAKNLQALKTAGFTMLNIANNHTWDYGLDGFHDTLAALEKQEFRYVGGGRDRAEAESLAVMQAGGLKVGFLGFTSTNPKEGWAKPGKPGVAYSDFGRLDAVVRAARKKCDVLIVSFHGGTELDPLPNEIQKAFGHVVVDAGADLVLGHHPHVLQPVEIYKGKPIVYSLGNFLFVSPNPATRPTAVARATLGREGVRRLEFAPVDGNWGRPKPADAEGRAAVLAALNGLGAFDEHPELLSVAEFR